MTETEKLDYNSLSREEQEHFLSSIETSKEVANAIAQIAKEDGVSFMKVWGNERTPKSNIEETNKRIIDYMRKHIPKELHDDYYYWGETRIKL